MPDVRLRPLVISAIVVEGLELTAWPNESSNSATLLWAAASVSV